ncbi:HNH endonuclease [Streptomyces sp. NPDC003832]
MRLRATRVRPETYRREDVFRHWGAGCIYCGALAEHLDHVRPLAGGGRDVFRNVVPACADCNLSKGAKSLADWVLSWR